MARSSASPCAASALLLFLAACTGNSSATALAGAGLCDDGGSFLVPPAADAGPADVSVGPGGPAASDAAAQPPDPSTGNCYVDTDCAVFPERPYCDGNRCTPATRTVSCAAGTIFVTRTTPEVRHTWSGSNGTFADSCDANGNLVEYGCAGQEAPCNGGPDPNGCDGPLVNTGVVAAPTVLDCGGTCHDGRCDGRCPQQGDRVTLEGTDTDGNVVVRNDSQGRVYSCQSDQSEACTPATGGQTGTIGGLGLGPGYCTGSAFGSFQVALDSGGTCSYACSILVLPSCGGR